MYSILIIVIRIIGGIFILILLGAGLVAGYLALSGRVSFAPRASGNSQLSITPESQTKEKETYFSVAVVANMPEGIKETRIVVVYDKSLLGAVKGVNVDNSLGKATVDKTTAGRITIRTIKSSGTAPKNTALFSFKIKGKKATPNVGTKISILLKKSFIKKANGKDMLTETTPIEATAIITDPQNTIDPPTCSGITLTPTTAQTGTEITAFTTAVAGTNPINSYHYKFDGTVVEPGTDHKAKHTFTTAGTYAIDGWVTDQSGNISETCTEEIVVSAPSDPSKPECSAISVSPSNPKVGEEITTTLTASPGTGATITEYDVDFDDGVNSIKSASSNGLRYTYSTAGNYTISGTVKNSNNEVPTSITNCTRSITVSAADNDNDNHNQTPTDGRDCDSNGTINILDFTCFKSDYGKHKDSSGTWVDGN